MSEELFDLLMFHVNALIDLRIDQELGRSTEGLNWPVTDTQKRILAFIEDHKHE